MQPTIRYTALDAFAEPALAVVPGAVELPWPFAPSVLPAVSTVLVLVGRVAFAWESNHALVVPTSDAVRRTALAEPCSV